MSTEQDYPPLSVYIDGLLGRCPRCSKGHMIKGLLSVAPKCDACGLDFAFADAGDGPAIIVMTLAGFLVVGFALFMEVMYQPPYWLHAAILIPLAAVVCLALLRPTKGLLIALQYYTKAAEHGRLQ